MATFANLPAEMHIEIAGYLDSDGIFALRQTCRVLAKNSHDIFVDRFFRRRAHIFTKESIDVLREISGSPFARYVNELELGAISKGPHFQFDGSISRHGRDATTGARLADQIDAAISFDGINLVDIFQNFQRVSACRSIKVSSVSWFDIFTRDAEWRVKKKVRTDGIFGGAKLVGKLDHQLLSWNDLEDYTVGDIIKLVNRAVLISRLEAESLNFSYGRGRRRSIDRELDLPWCKLALAWEHLRSLALGRNFWLRKSEYQQLCQVIAKCSQLEWLGLDGLDLWHVGLAEALAAALLSTSISSITLKCLCTTKEELCDDLLHDLLPRLKHLHLEGIELEEGSWNDVCRLLRKGTLNELSLETTREGFYDAPDRVGNSSYHAEGVHEVGQMLDQLIEHGSLDRASNYSDDWSSDGSDDGESDDSGDGESDNSGNGESDDSHGCQVVAEFGCAEEGQVSLLI